MAESEYDAEYEASLGTLLELADAAHSAVRLVPAERDPNALILDRLDHVLSYTRAALAATDPPLVSANAQGNLATVFQRVQNEIAAQPQLADQFSSEVLGALSQVPAPRGHLTAQEAKDAAKKFAQSTQGRLNALQQSVAKSTQRLHELGGLIDAKQEEFDQALTERKTEADGLVAGTREQLNGLEQRIETTTTEQAETFRAAQDERAQRFDARLAELNQAWGESRTESEQAAEAVLEELRRMEAETRELVGVIGGYGTTERYSQEVREQRRARTLGAG